MGPTLMDRIRGRRGPEDVPTSDTARAASISSSRTSTSAREPQRARWTLGILSDRETDEVPGSILLLAGPANQPLGDPPLTRSSSFHTQPGTPITPRTPRTPITPRTPHSPRTPRSPRRMLGRRTSSLFRARITAPEKKRTADGKIILEPQPSSSANDPLNWSHLRRNASLLSLGLYCMVGGGMTPILAAGFTNVAATYSVTIPEVALTTGLYMLGLGIGSVVMAPTSIIFGKRPVYLCTAVLFILTSVWCALSPNYISLILARIVQGIAVSPTECLPSATIAEIFFLHERAYRLGIYTLLLLGGKNIVPLVSAAIVQRLGWRWVFWVVTMVGGFCLGLLFFFVPESFWDRAPEPHHHGEGLSKLSLSGFGRLSRRVTEDYGRGGHGEEDEKNEKDQLESEEVNATEGADSTLEKTQMHQDGPTRHDVRFADEVKIVPSNDAVEVSEAVGSNTTRSSETRVADDIPPTVNTTLTIEPRNLEGAHPQPPQNTPTIKYSYTAHFTHAPRKPYATTLRPYSGRLSSDRWLLIVVRPFILFLYPSILWSTAVYACSVGWLIVLSESVAAIYRSPETYNFTALQTGLVYISPFIGGILGTAVAGKVSDYIVRAMSRRNGGIYEPEFRLVMAIPVAIATTIGLMGYGWAVEEHDAWIVPTVFFGVISFGCSLGSTTAITFAVDSYRQYAGEALVTLNFAKNVLHGLVFSLFFNRWLEGSGPKQVFVALGGVQLAVMVSTVAMYVYGKRARMWTVRKDFMAKF